MNFFIYFKNKKTLILELKMIKYYLRFAIHSYSKLYIKFRIIRPQRSKHVHSHNLNEISNIETNSNLYDEKIGDNVLTMHRYL